jgi:hypothetical protein
MPDELFVRPVVTDSRDAPGNVYRDTPPLCSLPISSVGFFRISRSCAQDAYTAHCAEE